MGRGLTNSMLTAVQGSVIRPVYLVHLQFGTTDIYLTDRAGDISWNGHVWRGNGWLQPIKGFEETPEIRATACEITLVGTISEIVAYALNDVKMTNKGSVTLGLLNEWDSIISDPFLVYSGYMDVPTIEGNGPELKVTISFENELKGLTRQNEYRYTNEAQKALFPGDKGFAYVHLMETWDGYWGRAERPKWLKRKRDK